MRGNKFIYSLVFVMVCLICMASYIPWKDFTAGSIPFADGDTVTEDNSGISYDDSANEITVQHTDNDIDDREIDWGTGANQVSSDDVPEGTSTYYIYNTYNGTFREPFDADVTSNGTTITMSIEQTGTGDLTTQFSSGLLAYDTTPADTIALTAGSDTSPQVNYIYILQSAPTTLVKSTSSWPSAEHIKVGFFFVQTEATTQTEGGALINHNWNDFIVGGNNQGHLTHITERIRMSGTIYFSGVDGNGTDTAYYEFNNNETNFAATSGLVFQLHKHTYPAFDTTTGDTIHVVNSSVAAYRAITNLFDITTDSTGATIGNNKYFNLTFWGVANKTGEHSAMMVNVPGGFFNTQSAAENANRFDVFTMPREFGIDSSTGFLIARTTFRMGATWTHVSTVDLRGTSPQTASGGAGGIATDFADNTFTIFDNTDNTKVMVFDVGTSITTGNTRTYTAPDADGTMALTSQSDGTIVSSNTTTQGIVEASIASEVTTGTDAARSVTPDSLAGSNYGKRIVSLLLNDSTALTSGDGKIFFRLPVELNGWNLVDVGAACAVSTGTQTYDIFNVTDGTDTLTTAITIEAADIDSSDSPTQPVINTGEDDVDTNDRWRIDVTAVGGADTTFAEVQLIFQLP